MKFVTDHIERLAAFVFLLIFAGMFWPPDSYLVNQHGAMQGDSNTYDFAAFAALAVFLGIACLARWQEILRLLRCGWPIFALVALAFLSAYWAEDPSLVIRRSGTVALTTLFGVYLVARYDFADLVALLVKIYAVAMLVSLAMIVVAPSLAIGGNETYAFAWRGAFSDKNTLGLACAIAMIVAFYAWYRRFGPRWLAATVIVASLILFKLADSKTPLVMIIVACYAAALVSALRRRSAAGLMLGFVLGVIGLAGIGLALVDGKELLLALGRDPTFTDRTKIWHYVIAYIARRPWLGYGFGGFWRFDGVEANEIWAMIEFKAPHAHNAWLEIGLGLGIVGMGAMALAWLAAFYRIGRLLTAPAAGHVAFCAALLAGMFIENLTEYEFFRPGDMLWVLFVATTVHLGRVGLRARAARRKARASARSAPPGRRLAVPARP